MASFKVFDLGLTGFEEAWQFQKNIFSEVKSGLLNSALILCQHRPVITLGRQAKKENIKISEEEIKERGIGIYAVERGGDVTYHGPGQLTLYPVFNLSYFKKDLHLFLRKLEEIAIGFLSDFGIKAQRITGLTGAWVDKEKIASVGIAVRNWIAFHGLSINIKKDDLAGFELIRPCGMDIRMTSLEKILGREIGIDFLKQKVIEKAGGVLWPKSCCRN